MRGAVRPGIPLLLVTIACSTGGDAAGPGPCPDTFPAAGSACPVPRIECEYGADPRRECRSFSVCLGTTSAGASDATWRTQTSTCAALPPVQCPASFAAAAQQPCAPKDGWCTYGDGGRCHCTDCQTGPTSVICTGMPVWHCEDTESHPGCPRYMPRIGSPCTPPGGGVVNCIYGCEWGTATCSAAGIWQRGGDVCPMAAQVPERRTPAVRSKQ
jgi:hypothetical protein